LAKSWGNWVEMENGVIFMTYFVEVSTILGSDCCWT
jgi:hypothetical protein